MVHARPAAGDSRYNSRLVPSQGPGLPFESNNASRSASSLPGARVTAWQDRFRRGDLRACEDLARAAVGEHPGSGKAWQLLGATLLAQGRPADAIPALRNATARAPRDWSIWDNLGIALQRLGDFDAAAETFRIGLTHAPDAAPLWSNASVNALESGNADEALRLAGEAIRLAPGLAAAHLNAGNALSATGRSGEAEAALQRALALQPCYAQALLSLGRAQGQQGRFAQAAETTRRALAIEPGYADAHVNLANYLNALGDIAAAVTHYRRALELKPDMISAGSGALFCLLHDDRESPQQMFAAHAQFGAQVEAPHRPASRHHDNLRDPDRRLRLGFVSGDLRDHPVARFLEPVWRELDRERFSVFAYDTQPADDDIARRLRNIAEGWTIAAAMPDTRLDARIRADAIDILFDLSGHTARNRMGVFARKPAPLQVSWIGYPATTGLTAIDYRMTDAVATPPGRFDDQFTEHLAYLPFMSVFERPQSMPDVSPPPLLRNGHVTFGSFNRLNKLGPRSLELWSAVLRLVSGSRFLVGALPDENAADELRDRFVAAGIDAGRLTFHRRMPLADYLALHAQVDVLLDALPFSSGTTANFALWMGVPTLTLAGASMAQRLGAARMAAAGLGGFIAGSDEEFIALAAAWSQRPDELRHLRAGMRARMESRAGTQPAELTRALERRLRTMWQRWCAGEPAVPLP